MDNSEKKKTNISTICLIFTLIVILCLGFFTFKFYNDKKDASNEVKSLNNQISELKENTSNLNDKVNNCVSVENNNSNNNSNTVQSCPKCTTSYSVTKVSWPYIISVINGVPYIVPIYQTGSYDFEAYNGFYYNHQFAINNIKSGVKKVETFNLGLDPSGEQVFFVMEDGSVRLMEEKLTNKNATFTSKELLSSSNNIESLQFTKGVVYGITSSGKKIKATEVDKSLKDAFTVTGEVEGVN